MGGCGIESRHPHDVLPELVLFDRDDTLVHDVPYNGNPALVVPVPGAAEGLALLRLSGIGTGVVTNQSAVGSGRISENQLAAVNARVEELLGPFDVWRWCPHARDAGCGCRKPAPGLVLDACAALGVIPSKCVVVGDKISDMAAAAAAGAPGVLVATRTTLSGVVDGRWHAAPTITAAVELILSGQAMTPARTSHDRRDGAIS